MATDIQRQVAELQGKLQDLNRQVVQVRTQIQVKERERKLAELQIRELSAAGASTNTYLSVGKMFLAEPQSQVMSQLELKGASLQDDITVLGKKLAYLEKTTVETQNGLKESVTQLMAATASA
ncbi:Prefoldin subunit 1 [Blastocladiella emersonii ATCC 22665]|nr:Prefoldin subunit 1 [Blastocladiella emersonii ATCC 22665]